MSHRVQRVMGTVVSIDAVGLPIGTDDEVLDRVTAWFEHVDRTFSVHRETSLVSRVGRGEVSAMHPSLGVDGDDLLEVLDRCAALLVESDGVFDAWAVRAPSGVRFDPSGFVKGWAVERAARLLRDAASHAALPQAYHRAFCAWVALGVPAFAMVLLLYAVMIFKPGL